MKFADKFDLVLEETTTHFFEVTSLQFPEFETTVPGTYVDEAKELARRAFAAWVTHYIEQGKELPAPGRGGYVIYTDGLKKSDERVYCTKKEVQKNTRLSMSTIDRNVKRGYFKKYKIGGRTLFDPQQIRKTIQGGPAYYAI